MQSVVLTCALLALYLATAPAAAQTARIPPPEFAAPASVGIDPERLGRLSDYIQRTIDDKEIPGAVVLVARNGKIVLYEGYGRLDPARGEPMRKDAIFRIFSMTKPITAATALRLVERGDIQLSDPVAKYLPAFKRMQVMDRDRIPHKFEQPETHPAAADILVYDLLRHTAGFADEVFYPGIVGHQYREAGIGSPNLTLAEAIDKVAKIPLLYEPGGTFSYSETAFTVLGRVLEVTAGRSIADIMTTELLTPLGMADTGFEVPPGKADRVAQGFPGEGERAAFDPTQSRRYQSPAAGLVSTALDYWRFAQMLLDEGRSASGGLLLAPTTVDTMLSNSLTGIAPGALYPFDSLLEGFTYGLGIGIRTPGTASPMLSGSGTFLWVGADGTMFFADRKRNLTAVVMAQKSGFEIGHVNAIGTLVMQSARD